MAVMFCLAMVSGTVAKSSGAYYHYRIRSNSLMTTSNYSGRDSYAPIEVMKEFASKLTDSKKWLELVNFHFYYRQFRWNAKNPGRLRKGTGRFDVFIDYLENLPKFKKLPYFKLIPLSAKLICLLDSVSPHFGTSIVKMKLTIINLMKKTRTL
jgi:hypothetical protein